MQLIFLSIVFNNQIQHWPLSIHFVISVEAYLKFNTFIKTTNNVIMIILWKLPNFTYFYTIKQYDMHSLCCLFVNGD